MNVASIAMGGALAGLVSNISGMTLVYAVLGRDYMRVFSERLAQEPSAATAVQHIVTRFGFGALAAFLYVAMAPEFGPGAPTIAAAALTQFAAVHVLLSLTLRQFGILTGWRFWAALAWGLAESAATTLAAYWVVG